MLLILCFKLLNLYISDYIINNRLLKALQASLTIKKHIRVKVKAMYISKEHKDYIASIFKEGIKEVLNAFIFISLSY
jgi:flagellar biosynthesis regulator FlbT